MNKPKRALISMIVVSAVFCLTLIFSLKLPFWHGNNKKSDEVITEKTDILVDELQENVIKSFSYQIDEKELRENQQNETSSASNQDSLGAKADAPQEDTETAKGTGNLPAQTSNVTAANDLTAGTNTEAASANNVTAMQATDDTAKASENDKANDTKSEKKKSEPLYADIGISVAKDYVNIRKEPSTDSPILGKLHRNSAATILETEGDWYYVESGSVTGYINSEFIKTGISDDELIDKYSTQKVIIDVDGLNVREERSTDSKKLTVVYLNEKYPVVESFDDWLKVKIEDENVTGYIKSEFVDIIVSFNEAISKEEEQKLLQLQAEARAKKETEVKYNNGVSYTKDDLILLACLVHSEAGTQSYEGKLAVANVVLNRVKSSRYPNTINAVIYQGGQFSVAASGSLKKQLNNYSNYSSKSQLMSIKAAKDALEGANNIGSRLYFQSYKSAKKKGYTDKTSSVKLGDHLFW
jgi:spore germination cell wall hydrolase CwlJ-like protein